MASPQLENGFTKIANEILEALVSSNMNGTEWAVCVYIIRKTYGWKKKKDEISLSQFLNNVPVSKPTLCKALKNLQLVKIIKLVKKGKSKNASNLYAFNKNYEEWQLVKKSKLVKKKKSTSKEIETQLVKKPLHTKESITKESITKARARELTSMTQKRIEQFRGEYRILKNMVEEYGVEWAVVEGKGWADFCRKYTDTDIQEQAAKAAQWIIDNQGGKAKDKKLRLSRLQVFMRDCETLNT